MTKRELIDKKSIMNTLSSIDFDTDYACDYIFHTCDYDKVINEIEYADVISEEEIVKPYLEKLKAELIAKYPKNVYGEPELGGRTCAFSLNQLLKMIDDILTEKEISNGNSD